MRDMRVLIVEDEILIALELRDNLRDAGATVVGPALSIAEAMRLIDSVGVTAAILDARLGAEESLPVAKRLAADGIPFILHTGNFAGGSAPPDWPPAPIVRKPADPAILLATLVKVARAKT